MLIDFIDFSRLMVSQHKSGIYISKRCRDDQPILQMLNFPQKFLLMLHLGVPLIGKIFRAKTVRDSSTNWELDQQMEKRSLSYGGRIQLANWVLYGKLGCWFQEFKLPFTTIKKVHSIIYKFIWNKTKGIAWSIMSLPCEEGGLNLRDPKILNQIAELKRLICI